MNLPHHHPLRLIIPIAIVIIAAIACWYVLTRPVPPSAEHPGMTGGPAPIVEHLSDHGPYYDIDATYPSATPLAASAGKDADAAAVATMRGYFEAQTTQFKQDSGINDLTADEIQQWHLGGDRKFAYSTTYALHTSPHTVSYLYDIFADTLGAHPNAYQVSFTFNAATGEKLALADVFVPGSDYLNRLSQISREKLPQIIASKGGMQVADVNLDMVNDGTAPTAENFSVFYFDGDALVIVFPPYQVGPWVIGTETLPIPKEALADILSPSYP